MEYDDVIKQLGGLGKYQKRLLTIIIAPILFSAFGAPITVFILGEQLHRCKIPGLANDTYEIQNEYHRELLNQTIPVDSDGDYKSCVILVNGTEQKCHEWVYDESVFTLTVASQFDLVCEDSIWNSHGVLVYFVGYMVAAATIIPLGDIIGRRLVVCITVTLRVISNLVMPFSPNVIVFLICRFFCGFAVIAFYQATFIIGMELVSPSKRLVIGALMLIVYCLGEYVLLFMAYFIRDWRWLQLSGVVALIPTLIFWWPNVIPESTRWLISRGRHSEALKIIKRVAKMNCTTIPESVSSFKITQSDEGILKIIRTLLRSRKLVLRLIIMVANWFTISFIYYALLINIGQLGGNIFVNFAISVTGEIIGFSMSLFLDITGRRKMHAAALFSTGIFCTASAFPVIYGGASLNWITIALSMIGRLGVSAAFSEIYIYTGELFPTAVRGLVIGICSFGARIAGTISPYVYKVANNDGKIGKALPLITYGVLVLLVALISLYLPETRGIRLKDKIHVDNEIAVNEENLPMKDRGSDTTS